jgi:site-specific recombinase XerD
MQTQITLARPNVAIAQSPITNHQSPTLDFRALYTVDWGSTEKEDWAILWDRAAAQWLATYKSPHTRRNYQRALDDWKTYLWQQHAIRHLWLVTGEHVAAWLHHLLTIGTALTQNPEPMAAASANNRLASVSSYYTYITNHTRIIDGQEISLFIDAAGNRRANPFRTGNLDRPKVQQYGHSNPIHHTAMLDIFQHIEQKGDKKTLADLRDFALLLTFYRTGWRADEVLTMTWGRIRPRNDDQGFVFQWRGKGNKEGKRALPERCYHAIVAYLKADGRYIPGHEQHIDDNDYIFRPLRTGGVSNLNPAIKLEHNRHITQSTANEILRRHLARHYTRLLRASGERDRKLIKQQAKEKAARYHLHSLRHSLAHELYEATGDLLRVSRQLNHSSIETTRIYVDSLKDPVDDYTDLLAAKFGI